jgi:hypothetical protein
LKGFKEAEGQFGVGSQGQRGLDVWLKTQIHPVANLKGTVSSLTIGKVLHTIVSTVKMLAQHISHQLRVPAATPSDLSQVQIRLSIPGIAVAAHSA